MRLNRLLVLFMVGTLVLSCKEDGRKNDVKRESVTTELRAPAYPLITIDPYTCAWSTTDQLFDSPVIHWTGKTHSLIGAIRVDGKTYRFLGKEGIPLKSVVPMANEEAWESKFTMKRPVKGWEQSDFNTDAWKVGKGAFGTNGMQQVHTIWETKEIWMRREFVTPEISEDSKMYLMFSHDDDFELYLNGKEVINTGRQARTDVLLELDKSLLNKEGENVIAAHCLDRGGLAYVDFGLYIESDKKEVFAQTATQNKVSLSATQTHYNFTCGPVDLSLKFVSPLLPTDLDLLSRPVNYIDYSIVANDGNDHEVEIYFETTPEWAVNEPSQEVKVNTGDVSGISFVKAGTTSQAILERAGDNVRIDWGYVYLASPQNENTSIGMGDYFKSKQAFGDKAAVEEVQKEIVTKLSEKMVAMYCVNKLGTVSSKPASGFIMIGYDDIESIQYFGKNLKAWWTKDGKVGINEALQTAADEYDKIMEQCVDFDNQLWDEAMKKGGKEYADLCILAFRQSIAAHKLVKDTDCNILFLSKENFSNGSIGTVDVTYPSAPLYLKYNPELLKGMLNPIFFYSESGKWTKPFAAHDIGTYPKANGQTYGGDMPVEECGNMIILTAAIAKMEGNAEYAKKHWDVLTTWANYLIENGLNPENQLCTDDFAGHFAHNTNLSIKAIMGIASYGQLAEMLRKNDIAEEYTIEAKEMVTKWMEMASDEDHY